MSQRRRGVWIVSAEVVLQEAVTQGDLPEKVMTLEIASFVLKSYEGALLRTKADGTRR
jgi:TetR/AcrR family transcriptional repressor of nem operon